MRADKIGNLLCIFEVNGVLAHTDGEGFNRLVAFLRRNSTNKRGIQTSRKQEANLCVRHKALLNAICQFFSDFCAGGFNIVGAHFINLCDVAVADKRTVFVIMSRRERHYFLGKTYKVFRLACKQNISLFVIAVIQWTNSYRVTCGDILARFTVINNAGKFRIKFSEHIRTVFKIHWQKNLAVAIRLKDVALLPEWLTLLFKSVKLAITHDVTSVKCKWLHTRWRQPHNR